MKKNEREIKYIFQQQQHPESSEPRGKTSSLSNKKKYICIWKWSKPAKDNNSCLWMCRERIARGVSFLFTFFLLLSSAFSLMDFNLPLPTTLPYNTKRKPQYIYYTSQEREDLKKNQLQIHSFLLLFQIFATFCCVF